MSRTMSNRLRVGSCLLAEKRAKREGFRGGYRRIIPVRRLTTDAGIADAASFVVGESACPPGQLPWTGYTMAGEAAAAPQARVKSAGAAMRESISKPMQGAAHHGLEIAQSLRLRPCPQMARWCSTWSRVALRSRHPRKDPCARQSRSRNKVDWIIEIGGSGMARDRSRGGLARHRRNRDPWCGSGDRSTSEVKGQRSAAERMACNAIETNDVPRSPKRGGGSGKQRESAGHRSRIRLAQGEAGGCVRRDARRVQRRKSIHRKRNRGRRGGCCDHDRPGTRAEQAWLGGAPQGRARAVANQRQLLPVSRGEVAVAGITGTNGKTAPRRF